MGNSREVRYNNIDYQSNFINYLPPIPSIILIKRNISFIMEVLEHPGSETGEHDVVVICE